MNPDSTPTPDATTPAPAATPAAGDTTQPATWEQPWTAPSPGAAVLPGPANTPDPANTPAPATTPPAAPAAPAVSSSVELPALGSPVKYDAVDPLTGETLTGIGIVVDAYAQGDQPARVIVAALPASLNLSADDVSPVTG